MTLHNILAACLSIVGGLYGCGVSNNSTNDQYSMRSLHLNGNDPSPLLSHQAVHSSKSMKANHDFPSHRLPARSIKQLLKECAGDEIKRMKYGKNGKNSKKGKKGEKNTKKKSKKNITLKKKKYDDGMLGRMYIGLSQNDSYIPTTKEMVNFLLSIHFESKETPDGFSWIFSRYSGCTGVTNRDQWRECTTCWICDGCRPCRFHFSPGLSGIGGISISLQLAYKNWIPIPMENTGGTGRRMSFVQPANLIAMVPPGRTQYTFLVTHPSKTAHGLVVEEETYASDQLTEPLTRMKKYIKHSHHFLKGERKRSNSLLSSSSESSLSSWNSNRSSSSEFSSSSSSSDDDDNVPDNNSNNNTPSIALKYKKDCAEEEVVDEEEENVHLALANYVEIPKLKLIVIPDDRIDGKQSTLNFTENDVHDPTTWCRSRSIFKTFRQESVHSLTSEFEIHWKYVRIKRLVRELKDVHKVKIVMMDRFYEIRECFRYYCASGGNAFGLSTTGFIALMKQARLIDSGGGTSNTTQKAIVFEHSKKKVRFKKPEAENLFLTMKNYAKRLQNHLKNKVITDDEESVLRGIQQKEQTLTLGLFMETILRCALIKFGHGKTKSFSFFVNYFCVKYFST
jgi:hypothetical protein